MTANRATTPPTADAARRRQFIELMFGARNGHRLLRRWYRWRMVRMVINGHVNDEDLAAAGQAIDQAQQRTEMILQVMKQPANAATLKD